MKHFTEEVGSLLFLIYLGILFYLFLTFASDTTLFVYSLVPLFVYLITYIYGLIQNFFRGIRKG